jgi:glyoxylase-like metal-dependent hydrolase (beta-lactamase superfamily II)
MKLITRILVLALLYPIAGATAQRVAAQEPTNTMKQAPGFYRGYVGAFEVIALSDGTATRHLDQVLNDATLVRDELRADHESEPVSLSINAYLVNTGSHLVLIDTGAGELFGSTSGLLISNLRAAGYEPDQIDAILLTHIHADHSGGLCIAGVLQFPKATLYVDNRDLEYFVTRNDSSNDSETLKRQVKQSRATVGPYLERKKVSLIEHDTEVVAGIRSISQPGHTPGHTAYLVQSSGHALLIWGDIIHASEIQFDHPAVTVAYDTAPTKAARARLREFQFAAEKGMIVGSAHISFPGLGHVRKSGSTYQWVPIPYSATAVELDPKP